MEFGSFNKSPQTIKTPFGPERAIYGVPLKGKYEMQKCPKCEKAA